MHHAARSGVRRTGETLQDTQGKTRRGERTEEYYSNYQRYQLMQVDKTRVILACRIIINDLLGKLYRYDYRFGYPLLHALEGTVPLPEQEPIFTVYDDIRQKLIAQGMPADQIAFIHEANTEVRKKEDRKSVV